MSVRRTLGIIRTQRPRLVCFIEKIAFKHISPQPIMRLGWQTKIGSARVFLMHFSTRGRGGNPRERVGRSERGRPVASFRFLVLVTSHYPRSGPELEVILNNQPSFFQNLCRILHAGVR